MDFWTPLYINQKLFLRVPFFFLLMRLGSLAPLWFTSWKLIAISLAEVFSRTYLQAVSYNRSDELTGGLDVKRRWYRLVFCVDIFCIPSTSWAAANWVSFFLLRTSWNSNTLSALFNKTQEKKHLRILYTRGPCNPLWVECVSFVFVCFLISSCLCVMKGWAHKDVCS